MSDNTGAGSSAKAYHCAPTRQCTRREPSSRKPDLPAVRAVISNPATVGPASIAPTANGNDGAVCQSELERPPDPSASKKPPQEMTNVMM